MTGAEAVPRQADFIRITTVHGTDCRIWPDTGLLCHDGESDAARSVPLTFCRFTDHPNIIFAFDGVAEARMLRLLDNPWRGTVIPFRIGRSDRPGHHFVTHPLNGKHVCAEPPDVTGAGRLPVNRTQALAWETFELRSDARTPPSSRQTSVAATLGLLLAECGSARDAVAFLRASEFAFSGECFAAVLALLPIAEIEAFARTCSGDPALATRLATLLSPDIWASYGIAQLADYVSSGVLNNSQLHRIGPELDQLANAGVDGQYWSFGHLCNAIARRHVLPRKKVCIVASCRNEGPYLLEWIAYHRSVGVTKLFLYSNDNDDASDGLLLALANANVIEWVHNVIGEGGSAQYKSYGHALQLRPDVLDYEWSIFIDLDEFLVFNSAMFSSVPDYIQWQETRPTDAIALCWLVYGPAAGHSDNAAPVHRRFVRRRPAPDHHVKSIFRPRLFIHSHCHFPVWDDYLAWNFRSSARGDHHKVRENLRSSFSTSPNADFAWINHYISKSAEEFLLRRSSPRAELASSKISPIDNVSPGFLRFFRHLYEAQDTVEDQRIVRCCPAFAAELLRLQGLPGVADATAGIAAANRRRLEAVLGMIDESERFAVADSDEAWFRTLLREEARPLV